MVLFWDSWPPLSYGSTGPTSPIWSSLIIATFPVYNVFLVQPVILFSTNCLNLFHMLVQHSPKKSFPSTTFSIVSSYILTSTATFTSCNLLPATFSLQPTSCNLLPEIVTSYNLLLALPFNFHNSHRLPACNCWILVCPLFDLHENHVPKVHNVIHITDLVDFTVIVVDVNIIIRCFSTST